MFLREVVFLSITLFALDLGLRVGRLTLLKRRLLALPVLFVLPVPFLVVCFHGWVELVLDLVRRRVVLWAVDVFSEARVLLEARILIDDLLLLVFAVVLRLREEGRRVVESVLVLAPRR